MAKEKRRGDMLSHRDVNEMIQASRRVTRTQTMPHGMIRDGQLVAFPQHQQREAVVVAEDFPLGLAGGGDHTYEIRFRYFRQFSDTESSTSGDNSSSSSGDDNLWQTDEGGKPAFMDASNSGLEFEAGDKVTAYFDQQRGMWLPLQSSLDRGSGSGSGCCGVCVKPEFAVITDCNVTNLVPRMRLVVYGAIPVISGGIQFFDLLHVSGCTFESDIFPMTLDFIPDDSDSSPQVRDVFWRAVVKSGHHESTLQLIEDGGGVLLDYTSLWYFDPLCGTEFFIKDRIEAIPGLAEIAPCKLCLYPYVNPVTSACLESLSNSIGREEDWPEFITLELISVTNTISTFQLLNDNAQDYALRFRPGSDGVWDLISDNPVGNAITVPTYSMALNDTAFGYKKLTTLAVSPTVPLTPNGVELGDPLFDVTVVCQSGGFIVNFLGKYPTLRIVAAVGGFQGWAIGSQITVPPGGTAAPVVLSASSTNPNNIHLPFRTWIFVQTSVPSGLFYARVATSDWILHIN